MAKSPVMTAKLVTPCYYSLCVCVCVCVFSVRVWFSFLPAQFSLRVPLSTVQLIYKSKAVTQWNRRCVHFVTCESFDQAVWVKQATSMGDRNTLIVRSEPDAQIPTDGPTRPEIPTLILSQKERGKRSLSELPKWQGEETGSEKKQ